jgi:flavin-dependent dehydrogenase
MYDIAIIGAGPAGARLARLIGQRYGFSCPEICTPIQLWEAIADEEE